MLASVVVTMSEAQHAQFSTASVTVLFCHSDWVLVAGLCGSLRVWRAEPEGEATCWKLVAKDESSYALANGATRP